MLDLDGFMRLFIIEFVFFDAIFFYTRAQVFREKLHRSMLSVYWYEKKDQLQPANTIKHLNNFKLDLTTLSIF